jgi:ParB-like chromosome segregation protein Spo0J
MSLTQFTTLMWRRAMDGFSSPQADLSAAAECDRAEDGEGATPVARTPSDNSRERATEAQTNGIVFLPVESIRFLDLQGVPVRPLSAPSVREFARLLGGHGELVHPLHVRPASGGGYELIDVHLRLAGAVELGWPAVPCRVGNYTDSEALLLTLLLNPGDRKPPADLRRCWSITEALRLLGMRPVDFAAVTPYTPQEISDARHFSRAFPRAEMADVAALHGVELEAFGEVKRDSLRAYARITDPERRIDAIVSAVVSSGLTDSLVPPSVQAGLDRAVRAADPLRTAELLQLLLRVVRLLLTRSSRKFAEVRAAKS